MSKHTTTTYTAIRSEIVKVVEEYFRTKYPELKDVGELEINFDIATQGLRGATVRTFSKEED